MIASEQRRLVFRQHGHRQRRFAMRRNVVLLHETEKVRREAALRVVGSTIAAGKMDSVPGPPFLPMLEHVDHVAAVLMQPEKQPAKCSHAVQEKVAQLLEEFALEVRQGSGIEAGKNFRMPGDQGMVL